MKTNGAFGWAIAAAIDRVLAGRTVGYGLNVQRDGITFADHVYGYARAPWEDTDPAVQWTSDTRCHIASMSKAITAFALALIIEKWNQVLDLPKQLHIPIPLPTGVQVPPLPWNPRTIALFLQYCPPNVRPEPHWAYRVYGNGQPMTVDSRLLTFIGDRLSATPGAFVDQLSLRNLLQMHSFLQPIDGDDSRPDLWGWISRMLARGLSASPAPNAGDTYRNENYTLLRAVVENVSGLGYQAYVYNNVLAPAGAGPFHHAKWRSETNTLLRANVSPARWSAAAPGRRDRF
jgi:CubicO group peptidase (beta-lactamase class C family)